MAKAASSKGATGVEYFAFDVTAGAYSISMFNTTGALAGIQPFTFEVPAGTQSYIGTFRQEKGAAMPSDRLAIGSLSLLRDLQVAKLALGTSTNSLELAKPVQGRDTSTPLCAP